MHGLRKIMGWVFGIASMLCIWIECLYEVTTIQILRKNQYSGRFRMWLLLQLLSLIILVPAIIFGVAWWTDLKDKISARGWGIAAGLTFVLMSIMGFLASAKQVWWLDETELAVGVIGLFAFLRRYEVTPKKADSDPGEIPS